MSSAAIIDAGVGNLGNLKRAVDSLGVSAEVTNDAAVVRSSRCLFLPGVGAFRPPREALRGELEAALCAALEGGAWLLGICVGFQLLFDRGLEFGETDGLGLLSGEVTALPVGVRLPHIGWSPLLEVADHPLLDGIHDGTHMYFVHGFAPEETPPANDLAVCVHGRKFPAVSGKGRVLGTQFHPEKSGVLGLRLLANFLEMSNGSGAVD